MSSNKSYKISSTSLGKWINHTKSVLLPEENEFMNFQNFKRLTKAPLIMYGNFECALIHSTDSIDFGPKTKKYQDHIVCSYGY